MRHIYNNKHLRMQQNHRVKPLLHGHRTLLRPHSSPKNSTLRSDLLHQKKETVIYLLITLVRTSPFRPLEVSISVTMSRLGVWIHELTVPPIEINASARFPGACSRTIAYRHPNIGQGSRSGTIPRNLISANGDRNFWRRISKYSNDAGGVAWHGLASGLTLGLLDWTSASSTAKAHYCTRLGCLPCYILGFSPPLMLYTLRSIDGRQYYQPSPCPVLIAPAVHYDVALKRAKRPGFCPYYKPPSASRTISCVVFVLHLFPHLSGLFRASCHTTSSKIYVQFPASN